MSVRQRASVASVGGVIVLAALSIGASHFAAHAQSADLVLCDRVAADPADPDKPSDIKGVAAIAPTDVAIALKYCKGAASKSRRALYELGRAYAANRQTPEAVAAYRKAADKGSSSAMVELGVLYGTGAGVAKDPAQARKLFERAAEAGNARAIANLAALNGGVPSDPVKARAVLERAAGANSADAEFQLGLMAAQGTGGPQDDAAARALFEKAAAQGNTDAMVWFGAFAELGRGGPADKAVAKSYYAKAAALGNEEAKERLKALDCPYALKDKQGNVMTRLCF
jgi:TPR repeat protein